MYAYFPAHLDDEAAPANPKNPRNPPTPINGICTAANPNAVTSAGLLHEPRNS